MRGERSEERSDEDTERERFHALRIFYTNSSLRTSRCSGFGVEILKKRWLRKYANILSYFDTKKYATDDAITIGCLHTRRPGWKAGILTFIESGGFTPTVDVQRVADNKEPTLILWGEDDEVLPKDFPRMFKEKIEHAEVKYLKECGHVPHLEKSEETKELILDFINSLEQ